MANAEPTTYLDIKRVVGSPSSVAVVRDGLHAARVGAGVCGWINNTVGLNALTVINDAGLYYNIPVDRRVVITMLCAGLNTVSDQIDFAMGFTDAINAGGAFYQCMPTKRYASAANRQHGLDYELKPPLPIVIRYSQGARCVTMRVQANDALAAVDLAWQGWVEREF